MLKFYLITVVFWLLMIMVPFIMWPEQMNRFTVKKKTFKGELKSFIKLVFVSFVPVYRFISAIALLYMAFCSDEAANRIIKGNEKE